MSDGDAARARAAFALFNKHLPVPDRLSRSAKAHPQGVALSWFKDHAVEPIAQMRNIASILEAYGTSTEMIWTERPGYIVYEGAFQIAAEPFADTPT
ncbi:MAG: hypothetical protein EOP22_05670 [Hyphomicrobiales bacterium]|nr:MAG: hypothetical protein EOP22_05670 [Hyphomicrobiales bacterium]